MKRIEPVRKVVYVIALLSIMVGAFSAALRKVSVSELSGILTFVFLGLGIVIDVITGITTARD